MARCRILLTCSALLATSACSLMPRELNLTPLWFHRLDDEGNMLEWDALWPILHYERTAEGGDDFRVRPLWRRVTEPEKVNVGEGDAVEHQFLWPLGRYRSDAGETSHRVFPLWSWRAHRNELGERDVDWYLIFPFIWGGASEDGRENYFAFLPFYADIPQFISYDRFVVILFPLYMRLDKEGHRHRIYLWPLIGTSSCAEGGHEWFRIYPFYGHDIQPGEHDRRFALWPFFAWTTENMDTDAPVSSYWFWPLFGWRSGRTAGGWMALWPFFQHNWKQEHFTLLTLFWPIFHYYWNRVEDNLTQWWVWPLVGQAHADDQHSWSVLWPLIWWRDYEDPDSRTEQQWVLPFWWHVHIEANEGGNEDFTKVWPLLHHVARHDAEGNRVSGEWSCLSLLPWRDANSAGGTELWGWLWELVVTRQRARDDHALDFGGRLITHRERGASSSSSVPFLFNYERDQHGQRTLRLFQFLPIPFGSADPEPAPEAAAAPEEARR